MVGEALNVVTPFGTFGGEPVKAMLLKRHYGVAYPEGTASLLLIQTVNSLAQVPFVLVAVMLLVASPSAAAAAGTCHPRHRGDDFAGHGVGADRAPRPGAGGLASPSRAQPLGQEPRCRALRVLEDIESRLFFFLRATPARFTASYALAFANWMIGAVEMFLIFRFLGHPISFTESWLLEGTVSIARSVSFFIPAHLGVQDAAITLLAQALTGSADLGVAVALVRRAREIAWSAAGLAIGGWFSLQKPAGSAPA